MSVNEAFRMVERIADRLNQNPEAVERGVHMAERIGSNLVRSTPHFVAAAERLPHLANGVNHALANGDRMNQIAERSLQFASPASHVLECFQTRSASAHERLAKHRSDAEKAKQAAEKAAKEAERAAQQQRARDQASENLEQLGEAGLDLLQALGWGAAGQSEQAAEQATDAAGKIWDVFTRSFWGPSNN